MRSSVTSNVVLAGLVVGLTAVYGCSSDSGGNTPFTMVGGSGSNTAGTGSTVAGTTSTAGSSVGTSGSGTGGSGTAGSATTGGASGAGGQSTAGAAGTGGAAGGGGGNPITKVLPTMGCGKDPGQAVGMAVKGTIATMGTKPDLLCKDAPAAAPNTCTADGKGGAWMYTREYYVTLPQGYDNKKAYPLVLEGPGCGGKGTDVYPLNNSVDNTVIRVGLTPPPNDIIHATNPGQGCFDDKEGDDSVDWTFYTNLWDKLAGQICFDQNRVFSAGNSSGSWFSNEVGCKFAGDPTHPIRGVLPNTGGLPTEPNYEPTCTKAPMAGMWVHEIMDNTNSFAGNKFAIARAMKVNGCTIGDSFDNTMFENFPIGGGNPDDTCKKIKGCPDLYPLVVCALPGTAHASHDSVVNPGFSTFIKMFEGGAFVTQ